MKHNFELNLDDQTIKIISALMPYVASNRAIKGHEVERLCEKLRFSRATLYRKRKQLLTSENKILALTPQKPGRKPLSRNSNDKQEELIERAISNYYLDQSEICIVEFHRHIIAECQSQGIAPPSIGLVKRRISTIEARKIMRTRKGARAAREKFELNHDEYRVQRALDVVQIDHTKLDILLCCEDNRSTILGRPILTICLDVASRAVIGFRLSFEDPNSTSVLIALTDAILPKPNSSIQVEAKDWPFYGLPKMVHTDNGSDLVSKSFCDALALLGIEHYRRPVGSPHYGGHVERVFKTINSLVHSLPGSTRSNTQQRKYKEPEKTACLTLQEMRELLSAYFSKRYHQTTHSALRYTPKEYWERSWLSLNLTPRLPPCPEQLKEIYLPSETRTIGKQGIRFHGLDFRNQQLQRICNLGISKAEFKYDPNDIRKIFYVDKNQIQFEIPCSRKFANPMSVYEAQELNKNSASGNRAYMDCDLIGHQSATKAIVASAKPLKKRAGRAKNQPDKQAQNFIPTKLRF